MTIIAPQRGLPLADEKRIPTLRFAAFLEDLSNEVNTLTGNEDEYTVSNGTTDRTFDADAAAGSITATPTQAEVENIRDAVLEIADVLSTLITDLRAAGVIP